MFKKMVRPGDLTKPEASHLQLKQIAGHESEGREIRQMRIQKPGLALVGYTDFVHPERVQILGATELTFLRRHDEDEIAEMCGPFIEKKPACIIATKGLEVPQALRAICDASQTPLFSTPQSSSIFIQRLQSFLEETLAPQTVMHGVLVDVYGVGILLLGKSGIGKSETALDLVERGHPLVADDLIHITRKGEETLLGHCHQLLAHCIEIRGLGILNVKDLFGVAAVRQKKRVDMVCELVAWSEDEEYDRLGIDERRFPILDVELPLLTVPVRPGRNIGAIIEVAARNQLLKGLGVNTAADLQDRLNAELARGRTPVSDDVE